ncbi:hypothetical protein ACWD7C_36510 [Streptomyces sp. NPDC005134]|uniref:hypothetical protein n=1 Tax=unclassified Streptomyces TaxID=2593676 RepID=UPI0033AD8E66
MTRDEIARLVRSISDLADAVRQAAAADKAEIYRHLGLTLAYDSGKHKVLVETSLNQHVATTRRLPFGVRGGIETHTPRIAPLVTKLMLGAPAR